MSGGWKRTVGDGGFGVYAFLGPDLDPPQVGVDATVTTMDQLNTALADSTVDIIYVDADTITMTGVKTINRGEVAIVGIPRGDGTRPRMTAGAFKYARTLPIKDRIAISGLKMDTPGDGGKCLEFRANFADRTDSTWSTGTIVEDCYLDAGENGKRAMEFVGHYQGILSRNIFANGTHSTIWGGYLEDVVVEGNAYVEPGRRATTGDSVKEHGHYFSHHLKNLVIRYNICIGCQGNGFKVRGPGDDVYANFNFFYRSGASGMNYGLEDGSSGDPPDSVPGVGMTNCNTHGNVFLDMGRNHTDHGGRASATKSLGLTIKASDVCSHTWNLFASPSDDSTGSDGQFAFKITGDNYYYPFSVTDMTFANNVIYDYGNANAAVGGIRLQGPAANVKNAAFSDNHISASGAHKNCQVLQIKAGASRHENMTFTGNTWYHPGGGASNEFTIYDQEIPVNSNPSADPPTIGFLDLDDGVITVTGDTFLSALPTVSDAGWLPPEGGDADMKTAVLGRKPNTWPCNATAAFYIEQAFDAYNMVVPGFVPCGSSAILAVSNATADTTARTAVKVVFNKTVDSTTANDDTNYTIFETDTPANTIAVSGASLANGNTVTLTTANISANIDYTVDVDGVKDTDDNFISTNNVVGEDRAEFTWTGASPPTVTGASSTAATTVVVKFSENLEVGAGEPPILQGSYSIDGGITQTSDPTLSGDEVTLTVSALTEDTNYTVTVINVTDVDETPIVANGTTNIAVFQWDGTPLAVQEVTAATRFLVDITFNEIVQSAGGAGSYDLSEFPGGGGTLTVDSVALVGTAAVRLTLNASTPMVHDQLYELTVTVVEDTDSNVITSPGDQAFVTWVGSPPGLLADPDGVVASGDNTTVLVYFDEEVQSATATLTDKYQITQPGGPDIDVTGAALANLTEVTLTTDPMSAGVNYTLIVDDVTDAEGTPNSDVQQSFQYTGGGTIALDVNNPPVAETTIKLKVTFTTIAVTGATTITNYAIHETATPANTIAVTGAAFDSADESIVFLDTAAMSASTGYTLTVNNVQNAAGVPIAPNSTATFSFTATAPKILRLLVRDSTTVVVVFDRKMTQASLETIGNYSSYETATPANTIAVTAAAWDATTEDRVALTVATLTELTNYTLEISDVVAQNGATIADASTMEYELLGTITAFEMVQLDLNDLLGSWTGDNT